MKIRDHLVFKNCADMIRERCSSWFIIEFFNMNKADGERAAFRMAEEVDMVTRKGSCLIFHLAALISEFANRRRRLIYVGGESAYSYVAYLLGITDINPITADYPLEFAFPYYGSKWPYMPIAVPEGFEDEIIDYMRSLFRSEQLRIEYNNIVLGNPDDEILIPFRVDYAVTMADKVIASKGGRESAEIFLTEKKAVFSDAYYGLLPDGYEAAIKAVADARGGNEAVSADAGMRFHTRDDVYRYGLKLFEGRSDLSYKLMDKVRKGQGIMMKDLLKEHGADEKTIDQLTHIQYLYYEGECIPLVQMMAYCMNAG